MDSHPKQSRQIMQSGTMRVKAKFQTQSCFVIPQREKTFNAPILASINSFDSSFHHRNVASIID